MKNAVTLYLAVTLCLEKREEVPVSRASRDCLCGGLLAASYPYISQARGWTDVTTRLDHQQDSPQLSVRADYLPEGPQVGADLYRGVR